VAKYRCIPNYELIRPKVYIQFDFNGNYETNKEEEIQLLDSIKPFIERLDKEVEDPKPTKTKTTQSKPKTK
jgi:hypothetical protein